MCTLLLTSLFFLQAPTQTEKLEAPKKQTVAEVADGTRSVMIIDPKERANDFLKAYEFLVQEKSSSKVYFETRDGKKISNVIDMKIMPGNTLIVFRYNTPQGVKYQVVEIENLVSVYHQ